ncbi:hypothetical protein FDECE_452 [Fusarium decemcellulare]|nr:hypothetical protein FDECE_452 [Fusarium decemcellulare]
MKASIVSLVSIGFANAVTITNYQNTGCTGNSLTCTNIFPGECCANLMGLASSGLFEALPPTGIGMLHQKVPGNNDACAGRIFRSGTGGCISNDGMVPTTGSTWQSICGAKKRDDHTVYERQCRKRSDQDAEVTRFLALPLDEQTVRVGKCKRSVHPDQLTLSDGTVFDIGSAEQADIDQLIDIAITIADASVEDVPEALRHLVKTEVLIALTQRRSRKLVGIESFNDAFRKIKENKNKEPPFTGRGQIIVVADSGIDLTHRSFEYNAIVGENDYLYDMFLPDKKLTDHHGHGTHVAATIVVPQAWRGDDNVPVGSRTGKRPDVRTLFVKPYVEHNARIHNNSHGSRVKQPDGSEIQHPYGALDATVVDEVVCKYPELLIVFAAGNAGVATTITSQIGGFAAAKNCITVGACFNGRPVSLINDKLKYDESNKNPPMTDQVPKFSSKGPTVEGRIKPDLVAPGVSILSALSSKIGTDTRETIPPTRVQDWQNLYGVIDAKDKTNTSMLHNGTSMAAPVVSGAAALVREAIVEKKPTSALVKALLIQGATYLGNDKNQYGYGRLNVETSLQLAQATSGSGFTQGTFKGKGEYPVNIQKPTTDSKLKVTLIYIDTAGEFINDHVYLRYKVGGQEKNTSTSLDTVQQVVVEKVGSSTALEVWVKAERCTSSSDGNASTLAPGHEKEVPYAIVWSFESVK